LGCSFFVIALVAALLGFTGIAAAAAGIAKFLFFLFLVMFLIFLILGISAGRRVHKLVDQRSGAFLRAHPWNFGDWDTAALERYSDFSGDGECRQRNPG
jgi:uncharacterized membrane protein YtjA (UPF0391 family)